MEILVDSAVTAIWFSVPMAVFIPFALDAKFHSQAANPRLGKFEINGLLGMWASVVVISGLNRLIDYGAGIIKLDPFPPPVSIVLAVVVNLTLIAGAFTGVGCWVYGLEYPSSIKTVGRVLFVAALCIAALYVLIVLVDRISVIVLRNTM